jgi:hypothetical protein
MKCPNCSSEKHYIVTQGSKHNPRQKPGCRMGGGKMVYMCAMCGKKWSSKWNPHL